MSEPSGQARVRVRVLICDDQAVVREGLAAILSTVATVEVVGLAENGQAALVLLPQARPNVVLMDLNMPVLNGVQATREICRQFPTVAVLVLTTYATDEWLFDAIRSGACGYLLKDTRRDDLVRAIHGAAQGQSFLDPAVAGRVMQQAVHGVDLTDESAGLLIEPLSEREREILSLVARGLSNTEIAEQLHLAHGTVRNYVSEIIAKLGASDRTHAAILAAKRGWI